MKQCLAGLLLLLTGCWLVTEKVTMDDPRIQPLLKAAAEFDRTSYGFTRLPKSADVRFESRPTKTYDAMLHIYSKTSRTIAFRKTKDGYRWIGDQEIFEGPKEFKTPDGISHEILCLTYEIEPMSGHALNGLTIDYAGEDPRLRYPRKLALADVKPILKEWGY